MAPRETLELGPRYTYLRELGSGGAGRVLLVEDSYLGREVALKLLKDPSSGSAEIESFQREFVLLAEIEHPGIARAYDFGYLGNRPYFTSEFIPGAPFGTQAAARGCEELLASACRVAEALAFLHDFRILHLDLKPSNIIVPASGATRAGRRAAREWNGPVIIDFGLYRRGFAVMPRGLKGSLPYMGPEYFRGEPLGPWTDVYALAVTLYRAATGQLPRRIEGPGPPGPESAWDPAPPPPSSLRPSLPRDLDGVLLKALALDPAARYPSARELHEALAGLGGGRTAGALRPARAAGSGVTVGRDAELGLVERFLAGLESAAARARLARGAPAGEGGSPARPGPGAATPQEGPETPLPAAVLVTGPAGMGHSHFLREVKVRAQTRGLASYLETGYPGRSGPPGALLRCLSPHLEGEARPRWDAFLARLARPRREVARDEIPDGERRLRRTRELILAARSISRPLLVVADGLEHFDEVSVELTADLVRFLGESRASDRPPLGLVIGAREEGISASLLRELAEYLLDPAKGMVISLGPLGPRESLELYRQATRGAPVRDDPDAAGAPAGLSVYQETAGSPARVVALAKAATAGLAGARERSAEGRRRARAPELPADARRVVLALHLLDRPCSAAELAALVGLSRGRTRRLLERLEVLDVARQEAEGARQRWGAGALAAAVASEATELERRRTEAAIAAALSRQASGHDDPRLLEAVRHALRSGRTGSAVRYGMPVARYLRSTHQNRAARELLREILAILPAGRKPLCWEVTLALADLERRTGEVEEGIRLLREALAEPGPMPAAWRVRLLLTLAVLYARSGDYRRADSLFREGFTAVRGGRVELERHELLHFLDEHASVKGFLGDHAAAVRLCDEGLRLARASRSSLVREVSLDLHATRANVWLRTFDYEAAMRDFETALEIADACGSVGNRAAILNNLGIVYSQLDRYGDAVRTFREAERASLRLDEGPSLTFIHGNLAVLHAKLGDFRAMERALDAAGRLVVLAPAGKRAEGGALRPVRRQRLFFEHHSGLSRLYQGRFGDARGHLEAAIELGVTVGDRLLVAFDQVFRGEALIHEGSGAEARRELAGLLKSGSTGRVARMAHSRLAFLAALAGRADDVERSIEAARGIESRPVAFLDSWDALYMAWAASLAGRHENALELLEPPARYFERHGLRPAAALAGWIRAEGHFLRGEEGRALEILDALPEGGSDLTAVLHPLLRARLLLGLSRERAADCLAAAGGALAGNRLPEWELRLEVLRACFRPGELRRAIARVRADRNRPFGLESLSWKRWLEGLEEVSRRIASGPRRRAAAAAAAAGTEEEAARAADPKSTRTLALKGEAVPRRSLIAESRAMRRLVAVLDKLRDSDLPVLIRGETGTGKELVARLMHAESRRAAAPFLVIDCLTLPPALLEAELFGARAGAFTDLVADRSGILEQAAGGTVLIDEIGGASLEVQAKLLRVLSEGTYRPLGAAGASRADVRFLFTTARDLDEEVRAGRFREDLYHRIRVLTLDVPPLRDRPEDVPALVSLFLREGEGPPPPVSEEVLGCLRRQPWSGNVRELRNLMARLRLERPDGIDREAVERALSDPRTATLFPRNLLAQERLSELKDRLERDYIVFHLRRLGGDTEALSRFLGISRKHLYRRCRKLGMRVSEAKERIIGPGTARGGPEARG